MFKPFLLIRLLTDRISVYPDLVWFQFIRMIGVLQYTVRDVNNNTMIYWISLAVLSKFLSLMLESFSQHYDPQIAPLTPLHLYIYTSGAHYIYTYTIHLQSVQNLCFNNFILLLYRVSFRFHSLIFCVIENRKISL